MDIFTAVADPARRTIMAALGEGELPAGEVVKRLPHMTQPAVSRHLKVMLEVGLVTVRAEAQRRVYALNGARLAEISAWLRPYEHFWTERLSALETHLARKHGAATPEPNPATLSPADESSR